MAPGRGGANMARNRGGKSRDGRNEEGSALSRRDFVKAGATAGIGAAALSGAVASSAPASAAAAAAWDYEADVVVVGGGAVGLTAAIRARGLGATVIVVDQNFDLGGKMLHSGAWVSLGGGDPLQLRDIAGASDR